MCQLKVTKTNLLAKRYTIHFNEKKRLEPSFFLFLNKLAYSFFKMLDNTKYTTITGLALKTPKKLLKI